MPCPSMQIFLGIQVITSKKNTDDAKCDLVLKSDLGNK